MSTVYSRRLFSFANGQIQITASSPSASDRLSRRKFENSPHFFVVGITFRSVTLSVIYVVFIFATAAHDSLQHWKPIDLFAGKEKHLKRLRHNIHNVVNHDVEAAFSLVLLVLVGNRASIQH
jgi:hypothetical protein